MAIVCLQCDAAPAGASVGTPCPSCGTPLVEVAADDELIGTVIDGRFEIVALLGRGGMGAVYRANQRSIGREVALKLMDQRMHDAAAAKRFFREAKLASTLAHPNTVAVIDFGQAADGRLYLVMELVAGRTLHDVLEADGAFAMSRTVRVGTQLCDALEAAHALGIVHRDLKPENVIVGERDQVKLLDFGLARLTDDPTMRATATGVYAGTPRYMPPEIATGAEPAPSQDIYALGVILAELATNRPLFSAPTIESLFTKKLSPADELGGIAPALLRIVERMVTPLPGDRPRAADVRASLAAIAASPEPPVVAPRARSIGLEITASGPVQPAPSSAFRPPVTPEGPYELDPEWEREKANPTGHLNVGQPKPSRVGTVVAIVAVVLVLGAGGGGAWWWWSHRTSPATARTFTPGPGTETANTVAIHITATPTVEVSVDGKRAGTTPMTLDHARGTRPIAIGIWKGTGAVVEVVPDRDREIDLSKR